MVPRSPDRKPLADGVGPMVRRSFQLWRRLLTASVSRARQSVALTQHTPRRPIALAALALGIGAIGSAVMNPAGFFAGALSAAVAVAWVLARYPVMRIAYQSATGAASERVAASWAMGALPHLLAFTPPLRFLAWLVGAALAYRTLASAGSRRRAARTVAAGFGVEAAAFVILITYRNIDVLFRLATG